MPNIFCQIYKIFNVFQLPLHRVGGTPTAGTGFIGPLAGTLLQTEEKNVLLTNSEAQQNLGQPDGKETQTGRASANRYA